MSGRFVVPLDTLEAQRRASNPRASAWVSANAGSGKTTVLAQRVIRLLLDGVKPGHILSITFTKAAAANMATRVFDTLSDWVTLDDAALSAAIERMEGRAPDAARVEEARRLFARAIETPGGLKIQTIHAFCERLLHLFPFEANVAARFEVLDDALGAELQAAARRQVLTEAAQDGEGPVARALGVVNEIVTEDAFAGLVTRAMRLRRKLARRVGSLNAIQALMRETGERLGLEPGVTSGELEAAFLGRGIPESEWPPLVDALRSKGGKSADLAASLEKAALSTDPLTRQRHYLSVFLTGKGEPRAESFITKAFQAEFPELAENLSGERRRVAGLLDSLKAALATERTEALLILTEAIASRYEDAKSRRGALDFDDLIARTSDLLRRKADAAWVLYKLDQGIDHILVDEAQDTSEPQWGILRALADEFVAGESHTGRMRTLFAVGDPKQSIYSFQGAAPEAFEQARRDFERRFRELREAGDRERWIFNDEKLQLSFRSAPDVLAAVDAVFLPADHHKSLSFGDPVAPVHQSVRQGVPGLVEVWEVERPVPAPDLEAWDKPLDEPDAGSPAVRLASRIAATVARWAREGDQNGHRIAPGDVLILVRTRNAFFEAIIRALKVAGVPVAGADRLVLTQHIAVLDLIALGRASLLPDDDLTLATVLKSPFIGLTDSELERLAVGRRGSLARALEAAAENDLSFRAAQERLLHWRERAATAGPFAFYTDVLGAGGGRKAVLARLGTEAGDAVDEFLRLALQHEQRELPSLSLFLAAIAEADLTIKRDMDSAHGEVRVMTVHGAKGLEASVVFLADTCSIPEGRNDDPFFLLDGPEGPLPVWSPSSGQDPAPVQAVRQRSKDATRAEYHRLLYVAMTRAKDRLIIAGFDGQRTRNPGCWYDMVVGGLQDKLREVALPAYAGEPARSVRRWQSIPFGAVASPAQSSPHEAEPPPSWLTKPAPKEPEPRPPLRPSYAGLGSETSFAVRTGPIEPGPSQAEARLAGTLVHLLLEVLPGVPVPARAKAAAELLNLRGQALAETVRDRLARSSLALLDDPALAALFGPGSRAEVSISGAIRLPGVSEPLPVLGQIDRLAVTESEVIVADFKTSPRIPASADDTPAEYVSQLAVYRALVGQIYPGRPLRAVLIWTAGPVVHELAPDRLDAALAGIKPA